MPAKIRVLVVDDSFFMRKVISDILKADPEIDVVGQASDGAKALDMVAQLNPDVVSLDIEMPVMNGVEALHKIMQLERSPPTLIVSGYAQEGSDLAFRCLSGGAVDIVLKPGGSVSFNMSQVEAELRRKIKSAAQVDTRKLKQLIHAQSPSVVPVDKRPAGDGVLVIGSSTGGPAALDVLLPQIPKSFPYPILVAQHLPASFVGYFIQRLKSLCQLPAVEATEGLPVNPGTIYVAKGGTLAQLKTGQGTVCFTVSADASNFESPSINHLLTSAAEIYKDKTLGVILTGMGRDGVSGAGAVKKHGGRVFAQDEATSVVYGMPREVREAHLADEVLPLQKIVPTIMASL